MPELTKVVNTELQQGFTVSRVAEEHGVPEPLVWSIALEGKSDLDRFKALNWELKTVDVWEWTDCDKRFGDDWPGRLPAQMIAHILYYFSDQGDLVFDPMAGGGVVADTAWRSTGDAGALTWMIGRMGDRKLSHISGISPI